MGSVGVVFDLSEKFVELGGDVFNTAFDLLFDFFHGSSILPVLCEELMKRA